MSDQNRTDYLRVWVPTNRTDSKGRFTHMDGWNELLHAYETSRPIGNRRMRQNIRYVASFVALAMKLQRWAPMRDKTTATPCIVRLTFVERDRRRDVGNIHGGAKYALDALTARHEHGAAAIYDDSQRWLPDVRYRIATTGPEYKEPGLLIEIARKREKPNEEEGRSRRSQPRS